MKLFEWLTDAILSASGYAHAAILTGIAVVLPMADGARVLPFFGVTLTTLGMSAAGSMIAFAYGTPVASRKRLYGYAIGGTFIGVWAVQILPGWLGWEWYKPEVMEPPIAGVVALLSRWIVPFVIEQIPSLWKRIFNTSSKGDNP